MSGREELLSVSGCPAWSSGRRSHPVPPDSHPRALWLEPRKGIPGPLPISLLVAVRSQHRAPKPHAAKPCAALHLPSTQASQQPHLHPPGASARPVPAPPSPADFSPQVPGEVPAPSLPGLCVPSLCFLGQLPMAGEAEAWLALHGLSEPPEPQVGQAAWLTDDSLLSQSH